MRISALVPLVLLCGCAAGAPSTDTPPSEPAVFRSVTDGYELKGSRGPSGAWTAIPVSDELAFGQLREVYAELGLPLDHMETASRRLGGSAVAGRQVAGEPLGRYLSCGTVMGAPIVHRYRVGLSVTSELRPRPDGASELRTEVSGRAQDPGSSSGPVDCATTGHLELRIARALWARVAR